MEATPVRVQPEDVTKDYDVVIVGARCAGAALAIGLARGGAKVLLIDKAALPSDQVLSTHQIHPAGNAVLDELGVGAAIRARTPEIRRMWFHKRGATLPLHFEAGEGQRCPRRLTLDGRLLDAARDAGAELRDRTRLEGLLWSDDGRVRGVRVRGPEGTTSIQAGLVVGADGRASMVAREVGAEEYLGYDAPRAMFWSYWDAPRGFGNEFGMYVGHRDGSIRTLFHTEDDQVLVGSCPPTEVGRGWRGDAEAALRADLALDPITAPLIEGRPLAEKVRGFVGSRYFLRQGAGPGWLLVGDAGVHKEFVVGDGITEALLQARSASTAIQASSDSARTRWWRQRDLEVLPMFFFGKSEGRLGERSALEARMLEEATRDPSIHDAIIETMHRTRSPFDVVSPGRAMRVVLGGVLRGRLGFLRDARRIAATETALRAELDRRRRLLGGSVA